MTIKVGLLGYGLSGRVFHLPLLLNNPQFEVVAAAASSAAEILEKLPAARICKAEEILHMDEVDLVVVATPNLTHAHYCNLALESGKHIVVEKPFTVTSGEGFELAAKARRAQKILAVFHNRRWDSNHLAVKHALAQGMLGRVTYYESQFDRFRPTVGTKWKENASAGSGVLFDLGSHLIDQCLDLFGLPLAVNASALKQRPGSGNHDFFLIQLHYDHNFIAVLRCSSYAALQAQRTLVYGDTGSLIIEGADAQEEQLGKGIFPTTATYGATGVTARIAAFTKEAGQPSLPNCQAAYPVPRGNYPEFYNALARELLLIKQGSEISWEKMPALENETVRNAESSAQVIRVIEACLESAQTGRLTYLE